MSKGSDALKAVRQRLFPRKAAPVAAGFRPARGLSYTSFFAQLHAAAAFDWYIEIGCRSGAIFHAAQGKTIAVDPFFQVERNVIGPKPQLHVFQQPSDDFFAEGFLRRFDARLSVAFLDGMHLFEFLLRDVMNTEAHSRPEGVILLHDCCPYDHAMTARSYSGRRGLPWTGDVWKVLPILQTYRPDLEITVFDCATTGLVAIRNLSPSNRVLQENYKDIVARYEALTLEEFGVERFFESFAYTDAASEAASGFPLFRPVMRDPAMILRPERSSP